MTRRRKSDGEKAVSQEIKDLQKKAKQLEKKGRELLAREGKNIREFRNEVARLKKLGVVSKRVNAAKQKPTNYMRSKVRKFGDVLRGEAIPVRAPKPVRKKYAEKGIYEERGPFVMVPKEDERQRSRIKRGMIENIRPLKNGEERRIILPFKPTDMEDLAHRLQDDSSLGGMKRGDELFGFRLFGHNMNTYGFPHAEDLAEYILTRYRHLFSGKAGAEGVKHFMLLRFKSSRGTLDESPEQERIYNRGKMDATGRSSGRRKRGTLEEKRRVKNVERMRKKREKETDAEREKRLREQRERSARNRRNRKGY